MSTETPAKPKRKRNKVFKPRTYAEKHLVDGLTPQQEAYCRARALGMSIKESAAAAGLAVGNYYTTASWERMPAVKGRINELCKIASENSILKAGLDRSWVISRLMTVAERCMQAEPVLSRSGEPVMVKTADGELAAAYEFDSNGANKALELLGKTLRMWDGKDNTGDNELANLSDDDIARIAAELATQTGLLEVSSGTQEAPGSQQIIEVQAIPAPD